MSQVLLRAWTRRGLLARVLWPLSMMVRGLVAFRRLLYRMGVFATHRLPVPVVVVGNDIGLGVIPLGAQVRAFVDALGVLNQQVAQVCPRVTLMAAGLPLSLKPSSSAPIQP